MRHQRTNRLRHIGNVGVGLKGAAMETAVADLPRLARLWAQGTCTAEAVAPMLRVLRNAPAQGPAAASAALTAGAVPALAEAGSHFLLLPPQPHGKPQVVGTEPNDGLPGHSTTTASCTPAPGTAGEQQQGQAQVLLCTLLAQALANLAASSPQGATQVWELCVPPGLIHALLRHPSGKVHEPTTMLLYRCCRALHAAERQLLTDQPATRQLWVALLDRALAADQQPNSLQPPTTTSQLQGSAGSSGQPGSSPPQSPNISSTVAGHRALSTVCEGCSEWTLMLVGHLAARRGQLPCLLHLTANPTLREGDGAADARCTAAAEPQAVDQQAVEPWLPCPVLPSPEQATSTDREVCVDRAGPASHIRVTPPRQDLQAEGPGVERSVDMDQLGGLHHNRYSVILLYMLAHEMEVLQYGPQTTPCPTTPSPTPPSPKHPTTAHASPDALPSTTLYPPSPQQPQPASQATSGSDPGDAPGPWWASVSGLMQLVHHAAQSCGRLGSSCSEQEVCVDVEAHVLEAALECLKALVMREDKGRGITPGGDTDIISVMCDRGNLMSHMLAMLACLQPIQNPRKQNPSPTPPAPTTPLPTSPTTTSTASAASANATGDPSTSHQAAGSSALPPTPPPASDEGPGASVAAGQQCQAGLPADYCRDMPVLPPYLGYRGDLLCIIANAMFGRPEAAQALAAVPGAVTLLLSQCQLDDLSPLAKEWSMWAVRNLCAGSPEACQQLAELQPVGSVDSPELRAMGMRLELDTATGKMKVVRTDTADQPT